MTSVIRVVSETKIVYACSLLFYNLPCANFCDGDGEAYFSFGVVMAFERVCVQRLFLLFHEIHKMEVEESSCTFADWQIL